IPSLKVGYNTVFGYYIEVTKTHAKRVPKDYIRKQTLVNAERYITPELKEYEGKITSAAGRAMELEYEIFLQLRERVAARVEQIQELAGLIAQLDAFSALAEVAKANGYTRPHFTDRPVLEIRDGRHPVVERREEFVPNDLLLREDEHLVVLTGPNMSGKCLTGDALVFTDRGLLPIIELMPQGLEEDQFKRIDLKVRGRNGIEGASHFYYGGIQETIRITTRLGYSIEGTKEHPIWVRDQTGREGWARLGELTEGDFVAIARDIDLWGDRVGIEFDEPPFDPRVKRYKVPKELNEDLAYLLGLLVGDGTLTYKNGYVISSGDDLVREEFARINLELFGYRVMTRGKETDLAVTSAYLRSFLSTLGLSYWKAYEKSIPRAILTAPKGIVAAFLRGLFDTDGYTEKRYGNIILSTSSARLAREVQLLLLNFGIVSSIKPEKTKARDNYLLSIFGENAIRFYQEIGFKNKKVITLKEAKGIDSIFYTYIPNGRNISHRKPKELITYCNLKGVDCHEFTRSREDRHFYDKVVRIELSKGPVYDLSVPDSHSFVANGFINHNSVYIRQIALIALMAQLGSFVPAREALLPIIDKIFTRVGASDMLTSGYSTFMVEMLETANILNNATPRSLIILDEMGRGTSTFDGVSIAWAVAEHLATKVKAKTLFATHYHELTRLAARVPGVKNMHVRVKEFGNEVIFLHRVAEGVAEGSYGVHVARLAGLPEEVTEKAAEILDQILKRNPLDAMGELRSKEPRFLEQLALFAAEEHPVIKRLISIDLDRLTPLEALELLMELKRELG
ncbi:TPA: hypothetical protein EYP12_03025, partial [Candidatus Bipolaricaulota bacterium]|nr:hypothetical protein [Candidatus Bipolaricaulota bacterium]